MVKWDGYTDGQYGELHFKRCKWCRCPIYPDNYQAKRRSYKSIVFCNADCKDEQMEYNAFKEIRRVNRLS